MDGELSELGQAAVWYCEHGFAIIPLGTNGESRKHPISKHGLNDWFDNPEDARKLWSQRPNLNIGIVCGTPSHGLVVIDVDVDEEKDKDGYATLSAWERTYGDLPETSIAITGSGGMHYLYRTDRTMIRPSVNDDLGIDIRSDGSYIVAPPSIHPNGSRYEWQDHPEDVPILTATHLVYDFIDYVQRNGGKTDESKKDNGKFQLPDKIGKGNRDNIMFKYASHLRAIGRSDTEILNSVMGANFMRCNPPLDSKDIQRIVRSACKYERGETSDDAPDVGRPGGSGGAEQAKSGDIPNFRNRKQILHNKLARIIMDRNRARVVDGALAVWTGKKWSFGVRAIKTVCTMYADDIKEATRTEVVKYITNSPNLLSVSSDNGFNESYYIQFRNGTWDVLRQEMVEPSPEMFIIGTLPIDLDLDAPYGIADGFLSSIADEDEQTERVMREIIGACMCSSLVVEQAPMLIGRANGITAANGKSTYIHMLENLLGSENVSSLDITMYGKPFLVSGLIGKLANLGDDIPASYLQGQEASMWKRAVTGDTVKADVKYGDDFDFKPTALQIFSMNVIPRLSAEDDGLYRRFAFIPFRRHFEPGRKGYDPNMKRKLAMPENLRRFAVLGLMELPDLIHRAKFSDISDMRQEVENVKITNDVVRRWIDWMGITPEQLDGRWVKEVYEEFKRYADEANESKLQQSTFTRRVLAVWPHLRTMDTHERGVKQRGRKFKIA